MIVLTAQNIQKSFGVNHVLKGASLTLQSGRRVGLVGVNGSGKTTLLRIIAGEETADSGMLSAAKGMRIGYLAQQAEEAGDCSVWEDLESVFAHVFEMEKRLRALETEIAGHHHQEAAYERLLAQYASLTDAFEEADGYAWNSAIQGVLSGLGFSRAQWDQKVSLLSGGERTRLRLARLLLQKPDILLLDEPTNHLDLEALGWLEQYLLGYKGAVVLVSHDRYFLDVVCTDIVEMLFGQTEQYEGNYTRYLRLRAERFESRQRAYDQQTKEIERQKAIILQLRAFGREKQIKRARSREKVLFKMERLSRPQDEKQVRFSFAAGRRTGDDVLIAKGLERRYGERVLFSDLSLHLRAGDRVALIGSNGVGKTTLLKLIAREQKPDAGTIRYGSNVDIGYYDQHQQHLHPDKTVIDEVWDDFPHMEPAELRSILGCFLFTGDDVFQPVHTLSGGEKGRVALTKLMLKKDNFLLLDEPTNHLDMDSREVLEQSLESFTGTLLAVSHDRYFINRLATRVLEMRPDSVKLYLGNYDDYIEKKKREAQGIPILDDSKTKTSIVKEKKKDRRALEEQRAIRARRQELERRIVDSEAKADELEGLLSGPEIYQTPDMMISTIRRMNEIKSEIKSLYDQWERLDTEET